MISVTVLHWAITAGLGFLVTVLLLPFRIAYKRAKAMDDTIQAMKQQIDLAVSNHLHTIQDNTSKTNELLQTMNADNRELIGFMRGMHQ